MASGTASTLSGFEGPEKLLEIWFKKPSKEYQERPNEKAISILNESIDIQNASVANCKLEGLRAVHPNIWKDMLKIVKCQVLSSLHNEHVDAYLLSESSMFIFSHRLTLKTCGTTTLLDSVGRILEIAKEYCGLESIDAVFYSRKAFLFPEKQAFPHGNWSAEVYIELIQVSYLDGIFEADKYDTAGYVIGKVNGDHWCLYLATPLVVDNNGNQLSVREVNELNEDDDDDITLEILMQDLDPDAMKEFWRTKEELIEGNLDHNINVEKQRLSNPMRIYNNTKLSKVYPDSLVDDYVFDPCGYSANGLLGSYYYTIHVTPEEHCSYASFETTIPVNSFRQVANHDIKEYDTFGQVVEKIISIFKPGKFSTTLFVRRSMKSELQQTLEESTPKGFRHRDRIVHSLGRWELVFSHYERKLKNCYINIDH